MNRDFGLEYFRASVGDASVRVPAISDWSIGMHVHHCCLAMIGICGSLKESVPPPPRSGFSRHFAFGVLRRDKALRFMEIHNRHHLRIISDIAAA
jgi:hypothetical protein